MANLRKALPEGCALRMLHAGDVLLGWELQPGGVQPLGALRKSQEQGECDAHCIVLGKN